MWIASILRRMDFDGKKYSWSVESDLGEMPMFVSSLQV